MFRKLFACCLRQRSEAEEPSFEDFVVEDLTGKPENMSVARWRARFDEEQLEPVSAQAQKEAPPAPPSLDGVHGEVVGKVNDAWLVSTAALVHDAPAEQQQEEEVAPPRRRRAWCRRRWAEEVAARAPACPRARRAYRLGRR